MSKLTLLLMFFCSAVHGQAAEFKKHHFSEAHLGTAVHLVFYTKGEGGGAALATRCFLRVKALDAIFSDYRADSEVSQLCGKPIGKAHPVSDELFTVIDQAQKIADLTDGAFDITLGKHTKRWRDRFDTQRDAVNYRHLILDREKRTVTLQKKLSIDLGGIGKGYIADQLMRMIKHAKIKHAAVIIGGETVLADAPPGKKGWKIGVENPEHQIIGTLELANTTLSTSGDSYQFFEADGKRKSHLIDPATKKSKINRLNVVTIAPTSMQADAWATALRILPAEKALILANKQPALDALFIPYHQEIRSTKNFPVLKK